MINCFILLRVSSGDMQRRRTGELALIQHRVAVPTLGQYRFDLAGLLHMVEHQVILVR